MKGGSLVLDTSTLLTAYELMLTSRAIDDACHALIAAGEPVPNYHSGRGQEAAAAGLGIALTEDDYLQFGYRDFALLLAKGVTLDELVCDLLLKLPGTTEGYGGIMHVVSPDIGIVGRNSVFGSRFGIAVGLALSAVKRGRGQVVLCPYGEAEGGRGPLYEAINFACLRRLPIVFAAVNNGYSISSRTEDLFAGGDMRSLWRAAPMPVAAVDGNDVEAVHAAASAAVVHAREGLGPSLLEVLTYRIDAHMPQEAAVLGAVGYRTDDEIAAWRERDPIARTRARLAATTDDLDAREQRIAAAVSDAFDRALAAPDPPPESLHELIYREPVVHRA